MKKTCGRCKIKKNSRAFHKNPAKKDGLQSMCKKCRKEYHHEHYLKNKKQYIKQAAKYKKRCTELYKDFKKLQKCSICGEDRWWILEFHHTKKSDIGASMYNIAYNFGKSAFLKELEKCIIVCPNCHADIHLNPNKRR